ERRATEHGGGARRLRSLVELRPTPAGEHRAEVIGRHRQARPLWDSAEKRTPSLYPCTGVLARDEPWAAAAHLGRSRPDQPFTAPETSPEVILLCTIRKKITTGMDISIDPAMMAPQSVPRLACWKERSHTGRVSDSGRDITTRASTTSFQAWMNPNTPVAISPGAIRGKVTRANAPNLVHPSIWAASSSSCGTPTAKPRSIQMVKGSTLAMYSRESPCTELSMSQESSIEYSEMIIASPGIICTIRMMITKACRPKNANRVAATAARNPKIRATTTVITVTSSELRSASRNGNWPSWNRVA